MRNRIKLSREELSAHVVLLQDAISAIQGLAEMQESLMLNSGTGEMPEWWSQRYEHAVTKAIELAANQAWNVSEVLDVQYEPREGIEAAKEMGYEL